MPKVSIIVPVYNVEKYLNRCLDSIIGQTYNDIEIICVNDFSTDNSEKILMEYKNKYPDILRVINNEKNIGLGKTREHALEYVNGEYIMFIDSDDYIKNDHVEKYVNEMEIKDVDCVVGGYIRDTDGKLKEYKMSQSIWSITTYASVCTKMYKREFITKNRLEFTDIKCGEDIYFSLCAFYCGMTYSVIDYAGYYYYYNRKSITGSMDKSNKHELFMIQLFDMFMKKYDIKELSDDNYQVLEYTYLANIINSLIVFGHGSGKTNMKNKCHLLEEDLESRFPNYRKNKYVGIFKPKGQKRRIKIGVGVVMLLKKMHLDRLLFYILAYI